MNVALVITLFIVIFLLIILSGIFSCSDIVYASVNSLRLKKDIKEKKSKSAKLALKLSNNYDKTISTILFSNNLVNIASTSLATILGFQLFGNDAKYAPTIMSIILFVLILTFGEILPKIIGRCYSYKLSKLLAFPISILEKIFFPIIFVCSAIGRAITFILVRKQKEDVLLDDELNEMVEKIEEQGGLDEDETEFVKSAIDFADTEAYEIMTPRVDIYAIDIDDNIQSIIKDGSIFKHSRIPVYKNTIDNIVGILPTKILLRKLLFNEKIDLQSLVIPVIYVPRGMGISEILSLMKRTKIHIVVVKDEYGGNDGIVTMEDILEELVGEIYDERDKVNDPIKQLTKNSFEIDGGVSIEEVFSLIDVELQDDVPVNTISGFVVDLLGRFAKKGDIVSYKNAKFIVLEADEFTITKMLVKVRHSNK